MQGRIPERLTQRFFAGLFGLIGIVFVAVFGLGLGPDTLA
jgi:ABC-type transporter Mla subunit MlaD